MLPLSASLLKVRPRDEKWRAAGWVLPSPCWGQQFTVLIETLTPSLLGAPLHSDKLLFCITGQPSALPLSRLSLITWLHLCMKRRLRKPLQHLFFFKLIILLTFAPSERFCYSGNKYLLEIWTRTGRSRCVNLRNSNICFTDLFLPIKRNLALLFLPRKLWDGKWWPTLT